MMRAIEAATTVGDTPMSPIPTPGWAVGQPRSTPEHWTPSPVQGHRRRPPPEAALAHTCLAVVFTLSQMRLEKKAGVLEEKQRQAVLPAGSVPRHACGGCEGVWRSGACLSLFVLCPLPEVASA